MMTKRFWCACINVVPDIQITSPTKEFSVKRVSSEFQYQYDNFQIKLSRNQFNIFHRIRHFAGQVNYSAQGFVEKNNDRIPRNMSAAFYQSKLAIVQSLFPEGNPNRAARHPSSVSSTIRMQLQSLLALLQDRKSHYVLCIKPNESKKPGLFELALVQHQIRYMSLMPLVNIWRMGYCHHLSHAKFFNRYKLLHNDTWPFYEEGNLIEGIATIIRGLPLPSAEFILGTSCVFMRSPRTVFELEEFRRNRLNQLMITIQTNVRSFLKRKKFLQMKRSQIIIARTWRTWRVSVDLIVLRQHSMATIY